MLGTTPLRARAVPSLLRTKTRTDMRQTTIVATPGKIHRHRPTDLPPAAPYLFPQTVILADGSSFVTMTTSPRSVYKLTRDLSNHPTWYPNRATSRDLRDEFGRIGKFKEQYSGRVGRGKRTERAAQEAAEEGKEDNEQEEEEDEDVDAFAGGIEDWMSEGAVEAKVRPVIVYAPTTATKGKGKKK